jgi:hypothetical protein
MRSSQADFGDGTHGPFAFDEHGIRDRNWVLFVAQYGWQAKGSPTFDIGFAMPSPLAPASTKFEPG